MAAELRHAAGQLGGDLAAVEHRQAHVDHGRARLRSARRRSSS
jgi:hypothetical protein